MRTLEKHISPDKSLTFVVVQDDEGDISLGFESSAWHTHGDILAALSGMPEKDAIRQYVDELINDKKIIAVAKPSNGKTEVWITDDPQDELKYKSEDEILTFRYWSGQKFEF
jgi:hypothetical protein